MGETMALGATIASGQGAAMANERSSLVAVAMRWFPVVVAGLVGVLLGIAVFTFGYAGGASYFGHESETCNQCHAMNKQYEAWQRGPHRTVTTCQSCHAPHDDVVAWAINEADIGFWLSLKFSTGYYPENIKIRDHNKRVTEAACLYCHESFVSQIQNGAHQRGEEVSCIRCHNEVGHLR